MRKKKIFLILALLCTMMQGTWAQDFLKWDGHTIYNPTFSANYKGVSNVYVIRTAAELAWLGYNNYSYLPNHVNNESDIISYTEVNYYLDADIEVPHRTGTTHNYWRPIGQNTKIGAHRQYKGTFYGNGHTIRIEVGCNQSNASGMFAVIGKEGTVQDLHLEGIVKEYDYRMVGGICGDNYGTHPQLLGERQCGEHSLQRV